MVKEQIVSKDSMTAETLTNENLIDREQIQPSDEPTAASFYGKKQDFEN